LDIELKHKEGLYELGDHVGEEALNLNLPLKLESIRKYLFACFSNCLLKNIKSNPHFPMPSKGQKKTPLGE
jgi:hypothetical protein